MTHRFLLLSASQLKYDALKSVIDSSATFDRVFPPANGRPEQPMTQQATVMAASSRFSFTPAQPYDYIIAIENGVVQHDGYNFDWCFCMVMDVKSGRCYSGGSNLTVKIPQEYITEYVVRNDSTLTIGKIIAEHVPVKHDNWQMMFKLDRSDQIRDAYMTVMMKMAEMDSQRQLLRDAVTYHADFPKPGITFTQVLPLFEDPQLCDIIRDHIRELATGFLMGIAPEDIYIAGLDARGYTLHGMMQETLECGILHIRKPGKLPEKNLISVNYGTEYSTNTLVMARKDLTGKTVVLLDDIIATGGSLCAAADILKQCGVKSVVAIVLTDIAEIRDVAERKMGEAGVKYVTVF